MAVRIRTRARARASRARAASSTETARAVLSRCRHPSSYVVFGGGEAVRGGEGGGGQGLGFAPGHPCVDDRRRVELIPPHRGCLVDG